MQHLPVHQNVAYTRVLSFWLIVGAQIERIWQDGMAFSNGAMAAGGVVSGRVIRSDGELPTGVLLPG